ncbi:MAG: SDR family NAD(P)-dependent oxidoreductase, partial [Ruminococcus sp.]|nr:SDR family NAD(P)-dependent oxidoreductase [Ruminococcus sp.]
MVNVKGKWALITGASRGIGYLSAIFMAKQGGNLVLHSRTEEHCAKVLGEVKALGVDAYVVTAELSDMEQVEKMCRAIDERGTKLDIIL